MDDSQAICLLRLCQKLDQIHESPTYNGYSCPIPRMTHEIYKFHLAMSSSLDDESLKSLCEDFSTCYLCFIMSIKEKISNLDRVIQAAGEEYLVKLRKEAVRFIEDIASEMENKVQLVNVGKFCEVVEKSSEIFESLQGFICKEIDKEIEQMKSAVEDMVDEDLADEVVGVFKRSVRFWQEACRRVGDGRVRPEDCERLVRSSQEVCKTLDYLACCV